MRVRSTLAVTLCALCASLFVGCSDPSGGSSEPISCETDDDCPTNYTCELDEAAAAGSDAGSGKVCEYDFSSSGGDEVVEGMPVSLNQLPQRYAQVACGRIYSCCDETERQEALEQFGGAANEAECNTKMQQLLGAFLGQAGDSVQAGRAEYHADRAGDCLATLEAMDCSHGLWGGDAEPDICDTIFEGKVDDGGECYSDTECAVGQCVGTEQDDNGQVTQPGSCSAGFDIGEACEWSDECKDGAYCDSEYDSDAGEFVGTCEKIGDEGESCDDSQGCREGLYCNAEYDAEAGEVIGTCEAPAAIGESCESANCVDGAFCETYDPETGESPNVCKALKSEGAGCNYGQCNEDTYCQMSEGGSSGTCAARKAAGEPCESSDECQSDWCGTSGDNPDAESTCQSGGGNDNMCDGT